MVNRKMKNMVALAKRLTTIDEGIRSAEEGIEVAIGQLVYLDEQERKKRTGVAVSIEYRDLEEELTRSMEYLRGCLYNWQTKLVGDLAGADIRAAHVLEKDKVQDEVDEILRRSK